MARPRKFPYTDRVGNGWRATVLVKGQRLKGPVRSDPGEAFADAQKLLEQRKTAEITVVGQVTLEEARDAVLADVEKRGRRAGTAHFYRAQFTPCIEFWHNRALGQIGLADVQEALDAWKKAGASPQTLRHRLQVLTRAFRLQGLPAPSSDPRLILPPVPARDPSLNLSWEALLVALAALSGPSRTFLTFLAGTGIRRTELARMRTVDLDVVGRRIIVPVGKKRPRELPMPETAAPAVGRVLALAGNPFLVPGKDEAERVYMLDALIREARAISGEKRLAMHELRRAFATRLADREQMQTVAALLGHILPGVTGLYVRAGAATLREAMEKVWAELGVLP